MQPITDASVSMTSQIPPEQKEVRHQGVKVSSVVAQFVAQYFRTLHESPHTVHCFYSDDSRFSRVDEQAVFDDDVTAKGQQEIFKKIDSLGYKNVKVVVKTIDWQPCSNGGVLVMVTGLLSNNDHQHRRFAQTFVLAQNPVGYFVQNDILRYLPDVQDLSLPEGINSQNQISPNQVVTANVPKQVAKQFHTSLDYQPEQVHPMESVPLMMAQQQQQQQQGYVHNPNPTVIAQPEPQRQPLGLSTGSHIPIQMGSVPEMGPPPHMVQMPLQPIPNQTQQQQQPPPPHMGMGSSPPLQETPYPNHYPGYPEYGPTSPADGQPLARQPLPRTELSPSQQRCPPQTPFRAPSPQSAQSAPAQVLHEPNLQQQLQLIAPTSPTRFNVSEQPVRVPPLPPLTQTSPAAPHVVPDVSETTTTTQAEETPEAMQSPSSETSESPSEATEGSEENSESAEESLKGKKEVNEQAPTDETPPPKPQSPAKPQMNGAAPPVVVLADNIPAPQKSTPSSSPAPKASQNGKSPVKTAPPSSSPRGKPHTNKRKKDKRMRRRKVSVPSSSSSNAGSDSGQTAAAPPSKQPVTPPVDVQAPPASISYAGCIGTKPPVNPTPLPAAKVVDANGTATNSSAKLKSAKPSQASTVGYSEARKQAQKKNGSIVDRAICVKNIEEAAEYRDILKAFTVFGQIENVDYRPAQKQGFVYFRDNDSVKKAIDASKVLVCDHPVVVEHKKYIFYTSYHRGARRGRKGPRGGGGPSGVSRGARRGGRGRGGGGGRRVDPPRVYRQSNGSSAKGVSGDHANNATANGT